VDGETPLDPHNDEDWEVREQDRFLPMANISRIMKKSLPNDVKISKEAKETVQECVSEFISFVTSEATEKCMLEKRKTISGDDLLWAMSTLGFDEYVETLKIYLSKYRDSNKGDLSDVKAKRSAAAEATALAMGNSALMSRGQMSARDPYMRQAQHGMHPDPFSMHPQQPR
jgi:nuclear transcription Y subunit beta